MRLNKLTKTLAYQYKKVGSVEGEDIEVEKKPGNRDKSDPSEYGRWNHQKQAMKKLALMLNNPERMELEQKYGSHIIHPNARRINHLPDKVRNVEGYHLD